jgi:RNA polymerase sigma-70 factor (ECF subfamily)
MTDVDDAVQKVFLVASRKLSDVAVGRERAFLFATAVRVASNERRAERRKRSVGSEPLEELVSQERSPERAAHDRALLDTILEPLPLELRSVVVLFECEQLTADEIGAILDLPTGTVSSRLRRAREMMEATLRRLRLAREGAES